MKTKLLPLDSPKYARRLAREINAVFNRGGSVYLNGAAFPKEHRNFPVKGVRYAPEANMLRVQLTTTMVPNLIGAEHYEMFFDENGQTICASREAAA